VVPAAHGTGVGAALMVALLQVARGEGVSAVLLEYVDGNDRAAAFYRDKASANSAGSRGWPDIVWVCRSLAETGEWTARPPHLNAVLTGLVGRSVRFSAVATAEKREFPR
jgi:hypothetical protein